MIITKIFLALGLLMFLGCDDGSSSGTTNEKDSEENPNPEEKAWLIRNATPESQFAPSDIESIVDGIVETLNEETQDVGMKLSFIPKDLAGYFEIAVLGANRAYGELGVLGNVVAPSPDDDPDGVNSNELQIDIFEDQLDNGAKGIGLAPHSSELQPYIDEAVDTNIPVITFDSDVSESKRQLYVGTINKEAGKTGGETLRDLIGDTTGTVVILGYDDEVWKDGYDRTHEARKVLEEAGHTVVIRHTDWGDHQGNVDFIQNALETADPPGVGCLGVFANAYACGDAVVAAEMEDTVKVAAFDTEPQTLEYMEDGVIHATHAQRVYYMGYLVPYLLYAINAVGLDASKSLVSNLMVDEYRIDTGLDVIPSDSIEEYNTFQDKLGVL